MYSYPEGEPNLAEGEKGREEAGWGLGLYPSPAPPGLCVRTLKEIGTSLKGRRGEVREGEDPGEGGLGLYPSPRGFAPSRRDQPLSRGEGGKGG